MRDTGCYPCWVQCEDRRVDRSTTYHGKSRLRRHPGGHGKPGKTDTGNRRQEKAEARARYDMEMRRLQEEREAQARRWEERNEQLRQRLNEQPRELPMMKYIWEK